MLKEHRRTSIIGVEAAQHAQEEMPLIFQTIQDVRATSNAARRAVNHFNEYCDDRLKQNEDHKNMLHLQVAEPGTSKDDTFLSYSKNKKKQFRAARSSTRAMFRKI